MSEEEAEAKPKRTARANCKTIFLTKSLRIALYKFCGRTEVDDHSAILWLLSKALFDSGDMPESRFLRAKNKYSQNFLIDEDEEFETEIEEKRLKIEKTAIQEFQNIHGDKIDYALKKLNEGWYLTDDAKWYRSEKHRISQDGGHSEDQERYDNLDKQNSKLLNDFIVEYFNKQSEYVKEKLAEVTQTDARGKT